MPLCRVRRVVTCHSKLNFDPIKNEKGLYSRSLPDTYAPAANHLSLLRFLFFRSRKPLLDVPLPGDEVGRRAFDLEDDRDEVCRARCRETLLQEREGGKGGKDGKAT